MCFEQLHKGNMTLKMPLPILKHIKVQDKIIMKQHINCTFPLSNSNLQFTEYLHKIIH